VVLGEVKEAEPEREYVAVHQVPVVAPLVCPLLVGWMSRSAV